MIGIAANDVFICLFITSCACAAFVDDDLIDIGIAAIVQGNAVARVVIDIINRRAIDHSIILTMIVIDIGARDLAGHSLVFRPFNAFIVCAVAAMGAWFRRSRHRVGRDAGTAVRHDAFAALVCPQIMRTTADLNRFIRR